MINLNAIKARLAEWQRLRAASPGGYLKVTENLSGLAHPAVDFLIHAHNTPIEDDLAALIAEVERLQEETRP